MDTFIITVETEENPEGFKGYRYDSLQEAIKVYWKMKKAGRHPEVYAKLEISEAEE